MKFQIQQIPKLLELYPAIFPMYGIESETKYCLCNKKDSCEHVGKHPMGSVKKNDTLNSLDSIMDFAQRNPGCNFALLLDKCSDLLVIDVDKRNGGLESFEKMQNDFGLLPVTVTTLTGGDGLHLYFKVPNKTNFQSKLDAYPGIDIKHNGLIMLPGSRHQSGKLYSWNDHLSPDQVQISTLPQNYFDLFKKKDTKSDIINKSQSIEQGSRNSELFKTALSLVSKGCDLEQLRIDVLRANDSRCNPPLSEAEVEQIINSALTYKKPDICRISSMLCHSIS